MGAIDDDGTAAGASLPLGPALALEKLHGGGFVRYPLYELEDADNVVLFLFRPHVLGGGSGLPRDYFPVRRDGDLVIRPAVH